MRFIIAKIINTTILLVYVVDGLIIIIESTTRIVSNNVCNN